ncbi:MAG: hypothetical protein J5764_05735 [Bacteroidales bacterium]|nr:hypothetical protein [Bacteroidales bacterium]
MKKAILSILTGIIFIPVLSAQSRDDMQAPYRRSSLYSLLISQKDQAFSKEIRNAYLEIPIPDKFNDHNLSVRVLSVKSDEKTKGKNTPDMEKFFQDNQVASRLVARWFNRDKFTGECNMDLIAERGLYNASEHDKMLAKESARGQVMLMDSGVDLIGNTFVVVNDIRYADKEKAGQAAAVTIGVLGAIASVALGTNITNLTNSLAQLAATYKGFKVNIDSYLYRLVWNDEIASTFYSTQYSSVPDAGKAAAFEAARGSYQLQYVGKCESSGKDISFLGINESSPQTMVLKACRRGLDDNVVTLQKSFPEFRTHTPIIGTAPITAYLGMKDGVSENSRFEVLEPVEDANGKLTYKRVGVVKPVSGLIWDNRFMAVEEGAPNSGLGFTTFTKVSGGEFQRGMLLHEID